jgi:hypothetical protein
MAEVRYVPAPGTDGWRAAVGAHALAVLPPAVTPQTAEAVWRRLDGGGIGALVEALTGAFGTSLTAIPPFALVVVEDDGMRVAVRGPLEVVLEGADGAVSVSGRGVATWAERLVPRVQRVTVSPEGALDEAQALPIASGVVPIGAVLLSADDRRLPVAATPAMPAPAAADAPVEAPAPTSDGGSRDAGGAEDAAVPPTGEPAGEPAAETSGEPSASDTWIPVHTSSVDGAGDQHADDSTIIAPRADPGAWAATVARSAVPAAPAPQPRPAGAVPPIVGDHDGATISVAEARAARGAAPRFEPVADVPPRQPARGRVRLSTGQVVELERPVVIGRRPRSTRASGAELPTLVAVESPEGDISRSHIEIRAEGEHVLVTDLATTNGTVLLRGGQEPVRLHPSEPTMVVSGDVLDLGDGVTVTFEDLP